MATWLCLALLFSCPRARAGKLDDIRDEVYDGGSDDGGSDDDDDDWFDDDDDDQWDEPTVGSTTSPVAVMVLRILGFP